MLDAASDLRALDEARVAALGKQGRITTMMKTLGTLEPEARKAAGQTLNVLKDEIAGLIAAREETFRKAALDASWPRKPSISPCPFVPKQGSRSSDHTDDG